MPSYALSAQRTSAPRDITTEILRGAPPPTLSLSAGGGSVALIHGQTALVGSAAGCDLRLEDRTVSRRHCLVTHVGAGLRVVDQGSRNGVRVGGALVESALVGDGQSFLLGDTLVEVASPATRRSIDAEPLPGLIGTSAPMRALAAQVRRVAPMRLPILVRGDSGSGKERVARALHELSPRAGAPFLVLNAATISRELCDSELFGHEKGAFTGAVRRRLGAFREADGGTLFLDEIASLPLEVQAKLLRVVEDGVVRPLGAETPTTVKVRLVVATCEPLEQMVSERLFRADLYERLAGCVVRVPPLRDRPGDIPSLARHLLGVSELGDRELTPNALELLRRCDWPGNVRQLRNVIIQAALLASDVIGAAEVREVLGLRTPPRARIVPGEALRLCEELGGNISAAARRAKLPRTTMRDLIREARASQEP